MKKYTVLVIVSLLVLSAVLYGCSNQEFPTGTFMRTGDRIVEYTEDGTFRFIWDDEIITEGTYAINGNEITFKDSLCDEEYAGPATYTWAYENGALTFKVVGSDACDGRRSTLVLPWFGPQ